MRPRFIAIIALTLGTILLLGDIPLEAAVPSFMPQTTRKTVLFKSCSAKKNAARKKHIQKKAAQAQRNLKHKPGHKGRSRYWHH